MPTVSIDGLRVEYADAGAGLPLVFIPGLMGSREWFRYQTSGLSDRYRVISFDLRAARGRAPYNLDTLTNDLFRFLDTLKVYEAVVIGHTLGATIALNLTAAHPERVLAVCTISAAPSFRNVSDEDILSHFSPGEVEPLGFFERFKRKLFGTKQAPEDESDPLIYLARHGGSVDHAVLRARLEILRETDLTPILPNIAAPALVVDGAMDWSRLHTGAQMLDELIADSTLEIIEDAGHFCFFTRHDLFNAALDDFISHKVSRI